LFLVLVFVFVLVLVGLLPRLVLEFLVLVGLLVVLLLGVGVQLLANLVQGRAQGEGTPPDDRVTFRRRQLLGDHLLQVRVVRQQRFARAQRPLEDAITAGVIAVVVHLRAAVDHVAQRLEDRLVQRRRRDGGGLVLVVLILAVVGGRDGQHG